jgi:hypothetical protein
MMSLPKIATPLACDLAGSNVGTTRVALVSIASQ